MADRPAAGIAKAASNAATTRNFFIPDLPLPTEVGVVFPGQDRTRILRGGQESHLHLQPYYWSWIGGPDLVTRTSRVPSAFVARATSTQVTLLSRLASRNQRCASASVHSR